MNVLFSVLGFGYYRMCIFQDVGVNATPSTSNSLTFNQLVNNFTTIYRSMAKQEGLKLDSSDVAICINQIRTFLAEFVKKKTLSQGQQRVVPSAKPKPRSRKKAPSIYGAKDVKVRSAAYAHIFIYVHC